MENTLDGHGDNRWNIKMGAAVIFLDLTEDSDNISSLLKEFFSSETEYMYCNRERSEKLLNFDIKSDKLTKELEEEKENNRLNGSTKKFVFAFYLELFKADKTIIDKIHALMERFSGTQNPKNASDIRYLICYRQDWEKESMLAEKDLQESIHRNVTNTIHAEYILYREAFGSYQMQEIALVRYLHMLSRVTGVEKVLISNESGYLCAFALEKYNEESMESNEKQIQEYNNWLLQKGQTKYPGELCHKTVRHAEKLVNGYFELQGEFAYWQTLFPRKASDYKRIFFLWHRLDIISAPHIEEEKRKCETAYLEQLEQGADWNELQNWIRKNITYHDFKKLLKADVRKEFMEDVKLALRNAYKGLEHQTELEQEIVNLYEKKISDNLADWENWRREVEQNLHKKQTEAEANNKYKDLTDCLKNIKREICFSIPPGIVEQGRTDWLLLKEENPKIYLQNSKTDIKKDDIHFYDDLGPWSVQMISIAKYKPNDKLIDQILKKGKTDEGQNLE